MAEAPILNFERIKQGATFLRTMLFKSNGVPINLTGFSARMQFRRRLASGELIYEANTVNGTIELDANGYMVINIPASQTALWPVGDIVYDCELTYPLEVGESEARVDSIFEGTSQAIAEVTKDL